MAVKRYRIYLALLLVVVFGALAVVLVTDTSPRLGLDLEGGTSVILSAQGEGVDAAAVEQTTDIIRQRIDALGVAEPEVTSQGGDTIQAQLPGVENEQKAINVIGTTAQLTFRQVEAVFDKSQQDQQQGGGARRGEKQGGEERQGGKQGANETQQQDIPPITKTQDSSVNDKTVVYPDATDPNVVYELSPARLTGDAISEAQAVTDPNTGQWSVTLNMTGDAAETWANFTSRLACLRDEGEQVRSQVAIVLDGKVETATGMRSPTGGGQGGVVCGTGITGGESQIDVGDESEAKDLALVLRYGSLPITLEIESVSKVSPTLGQDSLQTGIRAGALGLALVLIYVVVYYRALGFVVWGGLVVFTAAMYSLLAVLGEGAGLALSLAGVAGLIVSIGVTTDSYIVVFERLKDELRAGRSVRAAVERGTSRGLRTIVVADIVTGSAAVILFFLAVGPVKGFALTLGLSTIIDLLVAFFFTRPLLGLMARGKLLRDGRMLGAAKPAEASA
jgi:preprotein translocase subunit SecD